jgi:hypothetical protein
VATEDLTRVFDQAGVRYALVSHTRTESAVGEAEALRIAPGDVAKTRRKLRRIDGGKKKV